MSLKVRLKVDSHCIRHPRYNPVRDGQSANGCQGCDDLWVIYTYSNIARNRYENSRDITRPAPGRVHLTDVVPEPACD